MKLRYYQKDCISALDHWLRNNPSNPVCDLATGTGKSVIIAQLIKVICQQYPETRILCCIDTKELIDQNYKKLKEMWANAPAGVCSAGLKRKDLKNQILFTGIQSVYGKAHLIGSCDILIVDEAHMLSMKSGTMWQQFIKELQPTRVIGFTATPYRNDCGLIYTPSTNPKIPTLFGGLAYKYSVKQGMKDGFLSEVIPKTMTTHFDVSGVKTQNGDFAESQLQEVVNQKDKNQAVIDEIIKYGQDRKGWLIFSAGCDHAHELDLILKQRGYNGAVILGDTPDNLRDTYIVQFKNKELQYLINNAVLTKGFDAPHIDLLAAVRPTQSPVLWAQMIGRGFRIDEGKDNCLLLDFAENINRFGYIDEMEFTDKKKNNSDKEGVPVVKTCEKCESINPAGVRECKFCGHEFPPPEPMINKEAYGGAVLSTQVMPEWKDVDTMFVSLHKSKKPTPVLKVEYMCSNLERYFDWICLEHEGYARTKAIKWWQENTDIYKAKSEKVVDWILKNPNTIPRTIAEAVVLQEIIKKPSRIKVMQDGKFWRVLERDNRPPPPSCQPEQVDSGDFSEEDLNEIALEF